MRTPRRLRRSGPRVIGAGMHRQQARRAQGGRPPTPRRPRAAAARYITRRLAPGCHSRSVAAPGKSRSETRHPSYNNGRQARRIRRLRGSGEFIFRRVNGPLGRLFLSCVSYLHRRTMVRLGASRAEVRGFRSRLAPRGFCEITYENSISFNATESPNRLALTHHLSVSMVCGDRNPCST